MLLFQEVHFFFNLLHLHSSFITTLQSPPLAMSNLCDFKIQINDHHTFFLSQSIICSFSAKLRKMLKSKKQKSIIKIPSFPGGPNSFELISRFCYNNGNINMNPSNICFLHCAAIFLEMNEDVASCNLLSQTEKFFDNLFFWTLNDVLISLNSCELFFNAAESSGILQKLVFCLIVKISDNSELQSSPSSYSSTETSIKSNEIMKCCFNSEWWFEDLTALAPCIIEKMLRKLGFYGSESKNLTITRFLIHYLKSVQKRNDKRDYKGIVDTAIHGVVIAGRDLFSCRGLFWVLSVVSRIGIRKERREKLECLIGSMLDMATLDDLLVSGHKGVYDVNLVIRLVRVFVSEQGGMMSLQRMEKVGRLVDKYLCEISPDQSLKASKFLAVAESLPDSARNLYDVVYRALEIYLESHPNLTFEERTTLCRCLNYKKLTLETCKELAKNPRIPPSVAVQALVSQQSTSPLGVNSEQKNSLEYYNENEFSAFDLQKMKSRVIELENLCKELRGQMSKLV